MPELCYSDVCLRAILETFPLTPPMKTPATRLSLTLMGGAAAVTFTLSANGQDSRYQSRRAFPADSAVALQQGTLGAAWSSSRDLGSRLYRHRAGIRPGQHDVEAQPAPAASCKDAKGGMASAKDAKAAIAAPVPNRWEVFGSLFYYSEDRELSASDKCNIRKGSYGKTSSRGGSSSSADSSLDVFGGSVGVEYHINRCWSAGFSVAASKSEFKNGALDGSDIDSVVLAPYVSFYRDDALGSADLWADLTYGYGKHSYDIRRATRFGHADGSPDADTHQVEFLTGLNYGENDIIHGPFAGVRWITGTIDSFSESGPGGTNVPELDANSLVSILGYQVSYRYRQGSGCWVPQLRASWEHEFEDADYAGDEDLAVLGAGIGYWWDSGWNVVLDYEGRFGQDTEGHLGKLSAGKEF